MRVAIRSEAQQRICESLRGEFAVQLRTAVLAQRIGELERVELDVRVAVRQAFDEGGYGLGWAGGRGAYAVAYVEDERPVFVYKVVGGCLDCRWGALASVSSCTMSSSEVGGIPTASSMGFC